MESFVEDLKSQVLCFLCNERFVEPKLMQCFHTFCQLCIKTNSQLDGQVNVFKCPQCDTLSEFQELNDVDDLQTNPMHARILQTLSFIESKKVCSVSAGHFEAVWQCLDCDRSLCEECLRNHSIFIKDHEVVSLSQITKEDIEGMLTRESHCKLHVGQELESFCVDCDRPICIICIKDHHEHKITPMHDFLSTKKAALSENIKTIEKLAENKEELSNQERIALKIKKGGEKAQKEVKDLTKKLVKTLKDKEQSLLNEIQESVARAERNLRIVKHTTQAQEYMTKLIDDGKVCDMVDGVAGYAKSFTYSPFKDYICGLKFHPSENSLSIGTITEKLPKANPRLTSIVVGNKLEATKQSLLTVQINRGIPYRTKTDDVDIRLTPENDVIFEDKYMTLDGQVEVSFIPRFPGELKAEVKVHGIPVVNSPLAMNVNPLLIKERKIVSKLHQALNCIRNPCGIAVNKTNSKIAVSYHNECCVKVFGINGDELMTYEVKAGTRLVQGPRGLAFLDDNTLVIADIGNCRLCIIHAESGVHLKTIERIEATHVYIDQDSNIYVFNDSEKHVTILNNSCEYLYQLNVENRCYGIASHNGLVYICDGTEIKVLSIIKGNHSPTLVATIGGKAQIGRQLSQPRGLAIDNEHNLLVAESGAPECRVISKYSLDGRFIGMTCPLTNNNVFERYPVEVCALNDGQIVCISDQNTMHFF